MTGLLKVIKVVGMEVEVKAEKTERMISRSCRWSGNSYLQTDRLSGTASRASYFCNSFDSVIFRVFSTVVWMVNGKAWRNRG